MTTTRDPENDPLSIPFFVNAEEISTLLAALEIAQQRFGDYVRDAAAVKLKEHFRREIDDCTKLICRLSTESVDV